MSLNNKTILDSDNTVSTEDRFVLRKFIERFIDEINTGKTDRYERKLGESLAVVGFEDYPLLKPQFKQRLSKKFSTAKGFARFPKLKVTNSRFMFHLVGTYEEFHDGIIDTEGNIELYVIKKDSNFEIVKIDFFPRMLMHDNYE